MKHNLGTIGERWAQLYLRQVGILPIDQNVRYHGSEIDIVGIEKNCLVFIEVKTRRSLRYGWPESAVDSRKQAHMVQVARFYCDDIQWSTASRFDVVALSLSDHKLSIYHIRDAFYPNLN
ncbi:MAG: YraN family protein [Bacteroidota bacterium]|nr:YraN family protein [Bacteroidota bacterium]MEC8032747.1 YraN family protein [Bacteroidota bacterium]MEC8756475.1 YraN family protein [Bacteroidota bacterium]MEC8835083.1 YraN family protein [Bacteroidota bacterium]